MLGFNEKEIYKNDITTIANGFNWVYSKEEYLEQGFTEQELPAIRLHDHLFNLSRRRDLRPKEAKKMYAIAETLGL